MSDLLIFAAAFAAGLLSAVIGGDTFITFPALALLGVASFSDLPAKSSSAWAFRRDIGAEGSLALYWIYAIASAASPAQRC